MIKSIKQFFSDLAQGWRDNFRFKDKFPLPKEEDFLEDPELTKSKNMDFSERFCYLEKMDREGKFTAEYLSSFSEASILAQMQNLDGWYMSKVEIPTNMFRDCFFDNKKPIENWTTSSFKTIKKPRKKKLRPILKKRVKK